MTSGTCTVLNCGKPRRTSRSPYCEMHYYRLRRTGQLTARPQPQRELRRALAEKDPTAILTCSVKECDQPARTGGMCEKHYTRVLRHGDVHAFTHQRDRNLPRGPANVRWAGDGIGYDGMHQRVHAAKGSASSRPCVECGGPANQWSYDHADPEERMGDKGAYSLTVEHYVPRCVSCHKKFDLSVKPKRRAPVDLDEVKRLHSQGVRVLTMSKILGVGRKRIDQALDDLNLPRFPTGWPNRSRGTT